METLLSQTRASALDHVTATGGVLHRDEHRHLCLVRSRVHPRTEHRGVLRADGSGRVLVPCCRVAITAGSHGAYGATKTVYNRLQVDGFHLQCREWRIHAL